MTQHCKLMTASIDTVSVTDTPYSKSLPQGTRERLLLVAREVFSEHGFKGATVREICRRAEVNVAAVNYHFSSKEALFMAALNFEPLNMLMCADESVTCAKARLEKFIFELLNRLVGENDAPQTQLLMRELLEPSVALDSIVKEVVAPLHQYVGQLVRGIVGRPMSDEAVRRCVFSILGQCAFYRHSSQVIRRLHPGLQYDAREIETTARHITEFSLAGLAHYAQE